MSYEWFTNCDFSGCYDSTWLPKFVAADMPVKNMKIIRNIASLRNTRLDEPLCCTVAETVMSLYIEAVDRSSCGYSDPFSIGHETLMRHPLMSFHILFWSFMLIGFTERHLGFFLFYMMSQKSFPSCAVTKFKLKNLLWSLIEYQLQLLIVLLRIHFICRRPEK